MPTEENISLPFYRGPLDVSLPGLWSGIFLDDYVQVAALEGKNPDASPLGLYQFYPSDPGIFSEATLSAVSE